MALVETVKKDSLVKNVVRLALQIVIMVVIKLMGSVIMVARLVSMQIGVIGLALIIVIQMNASKALDTVWVNAKLDSMVAIATTLVQQTVIH